ncbi:hypothetical protein WA538_003900, partial [Blastocystis sp. DL]
MSQSADARSLLQRRSSEECIHPIQRGNSLLYSICVVPDEITKLEMTPEVTEEDECESESLVATPDSKPIDANDNFSLSNEKETKKEEFRVDTLSYVYQKWKHQYENEDISTLNHHVALHLLEDTFDLPSSLISFFLSSVVSSIASGDGNRLLTEADYKEFYESYLQQRSQVEQCFFLLAYPESTISVTSIHQLITHVIDTTPVLSKAFAEEEDRKRYELTVMATIFFRVNLSDTHSISLNEFTHSNFYRVLCLLSTIESVDSLPFAFSVKAYRVISSQFTALDRDGDERLSIDELRQYGDICLNELALRRVMEGSGRRKWCVEKDFMDYRDFVYLVIADENKRSGTSIRYWFHVLDVEERGVISEQCVRLFYKSQMERLKEYGYRELDYGIFWMTIKDLLFTRHDQFTLHDFLPKKHEYMIPVVNRVTAINMLVNTYKYLLYEHRDPSLFAGFDSTSPLMCDWAYYLNNWKPNNEAPNEALQECDMLEVETKVEIPSQEGSESTKVDETS